MIIKRTRTISAAVAVLALIAAGCGSKVTGVAVGRHDMTAAGNGCAEVSAPVTPISTMANDEPRLLIPQPEGWQSTPTLDSEIARFEMENKTLTDDGFAWVLVGLKSEPGQHDPSVVLDAIREGMLTEAGAIDVEVTDGTVCGHPAQTLRYTVAPDDRLPVAAPGTSLVVVAHGSSKTYVAIVSILTTSADTPAYQLAADTILTGFQVLPSVL
jgi:hypothetical protein